MKNYLPVFVIDKENFSSRLKKQIERGKEILYEESGAKSEENLLSAYRIWDSSNRDLL